MSDGMLMLMILVPMFFWIGKFYFDACKLLFRLMRWLAGLRPAGRAASPASSSNWPPFQPEGGNTNPL